MSRHQYDLFSGFSNDVERKIPDRHGDSDFFRDYLVDIEHRGAQSTAMLGFATQPSAENAHRIVTEADRVLGLTPINLRLPNFKTGVKNEMIFVDWRRLEGPEIVYKNKIIKGTNRGWNRLVPGQLYGRKLSG